MEAGTNSIWAGLNSNKGKRGRHPKDCTCEKCTARRELNSRPPEPISDDLQDTEPSEMAGGSPLSEGDYKDPAQTEIGFKEEDIAGDLSNELAADEQSETDDINAGISDDNDTDGSYNNGDRVEGKVHFSGTFLLIMLDNALPRGIIWAAKEVGYKTDKKPGDLKLTEKEIEEISPLADLIIQKYMKTFSIEAQFMIMLLGSYAGKL